MARQLLQRLGLARAPGTTPVPLPRVAGRIYTTTIALALILIFIGAVRAAVIDVDAAYPFLLPGLVLNLAANVWHAGYRRSATRHH